MKKIHNKRIINCILIILVVIVCVILLKYKIDNKDNSNTDKIQVTDNAQVISKNFPGIKHIVKVDLEIESRDTDRSLPSPDGHVYRGYIYIDSEKKDYYNNSYSWNDADVDISMKKIDNSIVHNNKWLECTEFTKNCETNTFWGTFYYCKEGIICCEFSGH